MAQNMGRGILAPENNNAIITGAAEMRTLGATTAAAIDQVETDVSGRLELQENKLSRVQQDMLPRSEAEQYGIEGPDGPQGEQGPPGIPGPGAVPADDAVAAYLTTKGAKTQQAADARFFRQGTLSVSVDQFGAVGDGNTDDTARIQAALNSGALFVYVPTGVYRISAPLRVPAKVTFFTFTATLVSSTPGLNSFITTYGSYPASMKRELAASADKGARTLTTKTSHPYKPGDILRLVSQRVSTNPDDSGDDQLGWSTVGGPGPFFAEFVRVQNVTATTVTLDSGILFNGYRPNNSEETDTDAGPSAYLAGINGTGDDSRVFGFRLEGEAVYGVRVIRAKNVRVRDVEWSRELAGRFIQFEDCYYSDAERCYVETRQWGESHGEVNGVDHAAINQYHCVASWHTGFTNCRSVRGTQSYDFTYSQTSRYPSVFCYVRSSTAEGNLANPVTAHPGTYGIIIDDNAFTECQQSGISVRSNAAEVTHNTVLGSGRDGFTGLYLFEGGGKAARVESNTIDGFEIALRVNDGGNKPFRNRVDSVFRANTLRGFKTGWVRTRVSGAAAPDAPQGITLVGNRFESDRADAVGVLTCEKARGINGLTVKDNEFILRGGSATTGVLVTANSKSTLVDGNVFHDVGTPITYDATGHDGTVDLVTWGENIVIRSTTQSVPANTSTFKITSLARQILLIVEQVNLDDYTRTGRYRTANSNVQTSRGFPVDNVAGWWEVEELATGYVEQIFHRVGSTEGTYRRRLYNGVPEAWKMISFTTA